MRGGSGSGSSWATRYGAAVASLAIGMALAAVGLAAGERSLAIDALVVMGGLALIQALAGRYGALRSLRGERDERESLQNLEAYRVAALAVGIVLFAITLNDLIDGRVNTQAQWLLALLGASYAITLLYFRWRER